MSVNITEYKCFNQMGGVNVLTVPPLAVQNAVTGESAPMGADTRLIRVVASAASFLDGVALSANVPEIFAVTAGQVVTVSSVWPIPDPEEGED